MVVGIGYFLKKHIKKFYNFRVDKERVIEREVVDYVLMEKGARPVYRLLDIHVYIQSNVYTCVYPCVGYTCGRRYSGLFIAKWKMVSGENRKWEIGSL